MAEKTETAEQKRKRQRAEQEKKDAAAAKAREEFDKGITAGDQPDVTEGKQTIADKIVTERAIHEEAERREHGTVDENGDVVDPSIAPPAEAETHPEADYKVYGSPALGGEPRKPNPNKQSQLAKAAEQAQKTAQIPQGKAKK